MLVRTIRIVVRGLTRRAKLVAVGQNSHPAWQHPGSVTQALQPFSNILGRPIAGAGITPRATVSRKASYGLPHNRCWMHLDPIRDRNDFSLTERLRVSAIHAFD
jgi:hypothetical protein